MSKGLASFPTERRMAIATRRANAMTHGCGYWGAVGYLNRNGIKTKEQTFAEAVQATMNRAEGQTKRRNKDQGQLHPKRRQSGMPLSDRAKKTLRAFRKG